MKKQIDPTIKAHLIRSAFYVLLLLAVCVIPFALAQRNAKQSAAAGRMWRLGPPASRSPVSPTARLSGSTSVSNVSTTIRMPNGPAAVLWYNGDFDGRDGLADEQNTVVSQASTYDNFIVPEGPGWNVTSVFTDNLQNTNVTGATWEIRTGVSVGNGGTIVASGMTTTPVVTPTGRSGFGFTEFMVEVTGLNVNLPALPAGQFYWLNVTPIGDGGGRSFNSTTSGANCAGLPCGNDNNSFWNSSFFGANFITGTDATGLNPCDFSMGVNGTLAASPTPTPTPTPLRQSPTPRARPTPPPRP
jgi:hypothetical protein